MSVHLQLAYSDWLKRASPRTRLLMEKTDEIFYLMANAHCPVEIHTEYVGKNSANLTHALLKKQAFHPVVPSRQELLKWAIRRKMEPPPPIHKPTQFILRRIVWNPGSPQEVIEAKQIFDRLCQDNRVYGENKQKLFRIEQFDPSVGEIIFKVLKDLTPIGDPGEDLTEMPLNELIRGIRTIMNELEEVKAISDP